MAVTEASSSALAAFSKPGARLARPGGFNGRVEGEEVRLEGDLIDGLDDLLRLLARGGNLLHRAVELSYGRVGIFDDLLRCRHELVRLGRVVGALPDHRGHLFYGRGGFFQRRGLLRCSIGEDQRSRRRLSDRLAHLQAHGVHRLRQFADFVFRVEPDLTSEGSFCDLLDDPDCLPEGAGDQFCR